MAVSCLVAMMSALTCAAHCWSSARHGALQHQGAESGSLLKCPEMHLVDADFAVVPGISCVVLALWERPQAPHCAALLQILPSRVRPLDNAQPPLTAHRPGIGMSAHGGLEYAR